MLAQIGSVIFAVAPMNFENLEHDAGADFVAHPVVGAMPPLEFMGEASETMTLRGKLFPEKLGGLPEMDALQAMRRSGGAHFYMRGDGTPVGWFVIEKIVQRSSALNRRGVGRVIEFDMTLKRSESPNADGIFSALMSLFG